ncbi:MAG TPA: Ig-like domain-containing protein [Candidatus Angelobacter sp.]|nr:Ig-like domain-containing protein [Candidatus Angelobacter sp.]
MPLAISLVQQSLRFARISAVNILAHARQAQPFAVPSRHRAKFSVKAALLCGTIWFLSGCGGGGNNVLPKINLTSTVAVGSKSGTMIVGSQQQFTATATFQDGTTQDVTALASWSSSAPGIATINLNGVATAVSQGSANIVATFNTITGTTALTVQTPAPAPTPTPSATPTSQPAPVSLGVAPGNQSIPLGTSQQFVATEHFSDGSTKDVSATVTWSSSSASVATISGSGLAHSVSVGSTTIAASLGTLNGSVTFAVGAAALKFVSINPSNSSIAVGTSQKFTATGAFTDGSTQDLSSSITWSSSNSAVVSVDNSGKATAKGQGNATVNATLGQVQGSAAIKITPASLVGVVVTPQSLSLAAGTSHQLTAMGTFSDSTTQDLTASVTWSSSSASATISSSGLLHAVSSGSATITATLNTTSTSTAVIVTPASLVSITLGPVNLSVALGTIQQLLATGVFSDGSTQIINSEINWLSSSPLVGIVDSLGVVKALSVGTTTITASVGSITASIVVNATAAVLNTIVVTSNLVNLAAGTVTNLVATGIFSDSTTQDITALVHWASSNPAVGLVSNALNSLGVVSALVPGLTNITATLGTTVGSISITVTPAILTSIDLGPSVVSLLLGTSQALTAIGHFSDGTLQDISSAVTWASSNINAVTVTAAGLISAVIGSANATISATLNGITGVTVVNVPNALVSISINATVSTLAAGTSLQLSAIGHFSDGSTQDISASVAWSSSGPSTLIINALGQITGLLAGGPITVSATFGGVTGTSVFTVSNATLQSITVTPVTTTLAILQPTIQFHAIGHFSDGSTQDITAQVVWSSSSPLLVIISNLLNSIGLATGLNLGDVTITATLGNISGTATVHSLL